MTLPLETINDMNYFFSRYKANSGTGGGIPLVAHIRSFTQNIWLGYSINTISPKVAEVEIFADILNCFSFASVQCAVCMTLTWLAIICFWDVHAVKCVISEILKQKAETQAANI